jgi:hypothetical protein
VLNRIGFFAVLGSAHVGEAAATASSACRAAPFKRRRDLQQDISYIQDARTKRDERED